MSRTPKREIHKLPIWVKEELAKRDQEIDRLVLELETLTAVVEQLEETNEELAKRGEENALTALNGDAVAVLGIGTNYRTVDL